MTSTIYLRTETQGKVDRDKDQLTCQLSAICSCFHRYRSRCEHAPSPAAWPVAPPLLLDNDPGHGSRMEALYLVFDPPAATCGLGSSWLLRVSTQGATQTLEQAKQFVGIRATGMTLAGGGREVIIAGVSQGAGPRAVVLQANDVLTRGGGWRYKPIVESWREVR